MAPVVERRKNIQFAKGHVFQGNLPRSVFGWVAEPKFDGLRMILDPDNMQALTLTGLPIPNAMHIVEQMRDSGVFTGMVVDCEGLAEDWNLSQHIIKSQKPVPEAEQLKAYCFDRLARVAQWEAKRCMEDYRHRKESLSMMLDRGNCPNLVKVPSWRVDTEQDVRCLMLKMVTEGWGGIKGGAGIEGVMAKDLSAPYAFRKNGYWLKAKPLFDADLTCIGATEGRGKWTGMLGNFVLQGEVEWNGKMIFIDTEAGIGTNIDGVSSLPDSVRIELWRQYLADSSTLCGRIVEVKHEGVTVNSALRFPKFHRFRTDKEDGLA